MTQCIFNIRHVENWNLNWVDFIKGTCNKKLGLEDEIMVSELAAKNEDVEMKVDSLVIALKSLICHSSLYHKGFSFALENNHQKLRWCTQLLPHVLWRHSTGDLKIGWRQHISRYGIHTHKIGGRFYFLRRGKNNQKGRGFLVFFVLLRVFMCLECAPFLLLT